MDSFPPETKFKYSWRSYQERVISELEEHLDDNKLHVVAAPGSGKTVLGLEVVRRLNRPTLILAPTITIKNQWVDRFISLFLPDDIKKPDWISTDIKKPAFLTVSTYQALHCALSGEKNTEETDEEIEEEAEEENIVSDEKIDIITLLKNQGINTIVVDEAHHLRTEWWKSLTKLTNIIERPRIVSLTATPPFDVDPLEWQRYTDLCGPIDTEISVPELVKKENLCPHQDYVYLSMPSEEEEAKIKEFRQNVKRFYDEITKNYFFIQAVEQHPWIKWTESHIEEILDKPDYFSSMIIFLSHVGRDLPKEFFEILGVSKKMIPHLSFEWLEILLTEIIYDDFENYYDYRENIEEVKKYLNRIGATERRKVILRNTKEINKILASSITKLDSIVDIIKLEEESLKEKLRLVILTDFIRKTDMPNNSEDIKPLNRIGVVPIFEKIRREKINGIKLGILSGSLVIIPNNSVESLRKIAYNNRIDITKIRTRRLIHDPDYASAEIIGADRKKIVRIITQLFSKGSVNVLVGTKSLLGEGWDAPSINSLILASFVGSYMLSNQMRGRAIRTQPETPEKTANIWHLVCVEKEKIFDDKNQAFGNRNTIDDDYHMIKRRFRSFVGVSFYAPIIENGIDRLDMGEPPFKKARVETINNKMKNGAKNREVLKKQWDDALDAGEKIREELSVEKTALPTSFVYVNVVKILIQMGLFFFFLLLINFMTHIVIYSLAGVVILSAILFLVALIIGLLPYTLKAVYLFLRYGTASSSLKQICEAVLKTLAFNDLIRTDVNKLVVKMQKLDKELDIVSCSLVGGTSYEQSLFLNCLEEIFAPIENPRYLIIKKSRLSFYNRIDYHNVPKIIAKRKEYAEYFSKMWKKHVGSNELIYTRSKEGRKILLRARSHSLANAFLKKSERKSTWK